ncbi:MAG: CapA family protein [Acidobacteria bacterium]|nr:CapA family protein [Acidobacteriota bacterium]
MIMTQRRNLINRRAAAKSGGSGISIVIAADWAPIRALEPVVRSAPDSVYGDMLPVLRGADLRIVNCECALTAARTPVWKSGAVFKGLPAHVAGLTRVPFEVACLANNHVFDYGVRGFRDTLDVLHRNGIQTVGAGLSYKEASSPLTVLVKGTRVTILNFSEGEDLMASRGGPGVCGWRSTGSSPSSGKPRGGAISSLPLGTPDWSTSPFLRRTSSKPTGPWPRPERTASSATTPMSRRAWKSGADG